jgi:hypothetical protein
MQNLSSSAQQVSQRSAAIERVQIIPGFASSSRLDFARPFAFNRPKTLLSRG